jgi:hypothetical protein
MGEDLNYLGLSPAQERAAQAISTLAEEVDPQGGGKIVFLTGHSGSGTSHLLRSAMRRLDELGFRVALGGLAESPQSDQETGWARQAGALATSALSVASVLEPSLSLAASIAGFSAAASGVLSAQRYEVGSTELIARVLRAAAQEAPERPLVCLVDDATSLSGDWWTELQFSFAKEVAEELSLVLLLAVEEPTTGGGPSEEQSSSRVARSLLKRELADVVPLEALSSNELRGWLGLSPRSAAKEVTELTQGRTGEAIELWRAWLSYGVVESTERGSHINDTDAISHDAATELAARMERLRGAGERAEEDLLREALALGALEGRTFTAAAVARALNRDRDMVEDLLDELVAERPEAGILSTPQPIEVQDPLDHSARTLWRYEFSGNLLWRAAQDCLSDSPAKAAAASMLAAVVDSYGNEIPLILPALARLADLAGDQAEATRFRSLVSYPSVAALAAQADLLLESDKSGWEPADYRDASKVLSEAATGLREHRDMRDLLQLAHHAAEDARAAGEVGKRALAVALMVESFLLSYIGNTAPAKAKVEEARAMVQHGEPNLLATVLRQLAEIMRERFEDADEQRALLEESLRLFRRTRNRVGEATVQSDLAAIAIREDDLTLARRLNREALVGMQGAGDKSQELFVIKQLANIELKARNLDRARELSEEVLRRRLAEGNERRVAGCRLMLSRIEQLSGNFEQAWTLGKAALAFFRNGDDPGAEARTLHILGDTALGLDEEVPARELLEEARSILKRLGDEEQLAEVEDKLEALSDLSR